MDFMAGGEFDFSTVDDIQDYEPLPAGEYHCVVAGTEIKTSNNANTMWVFQLEVLAGPHKGRKISDQVTFTQKGINRVKFVLGHLADVDVSGKVNLPAAYAALMGKQAIVKVHVEEQPSIKDPSKMFRTNKVDFRGYSRPDGFAYLPWGDGGNTAGTQAAHQSQPPITSTPNAAPPRKDGLAF